MPFWVQLVVPVVVILALAALVWKGAVNGDEPTDALAKVALRQHKGPESTEIIAHIAVDNRTDGTVLVAARSGPIPWFAFETGVPATRGTMVMRSQTLGDREVLGAVEPGGQRTFTIPVENRGKRYLRVLVEIDQPERRTRVITTMHDLQALNLLPSRGR